MYLWRCALVTLIAATNNIYFIRTMKSSPGLQLIKIKNM